MFCLLCHRGSAPPQRHRALPGALDQAKTLWRFGFDLDENNTKNNGKKKGCRSTGFGLWVSVVEVWKKFMFFFAKSSCCYVCFRSYSLNM